MIKLKIKNTSNNELPCYKHIGDSGMDIKAFLEEPITLKPLGRALISTGLYIEIPEGYEIQVRPRSGIALKRGLTVLNTPGTIDSNYTGEICVILVNLSDEEQIVEPGERIAQLVLAKVETASLEEVDIIQDNDHRGDSGFGDSGRF